MDAFPILSLVTLMPLAGALLILFIPRESEGEIRWSSLGITLLTLAASIPILLGFDGSRDAAAFQFRETYRWLPSVGVSYKIGIDGISLFLVLLTAFLGPVCVLASWRAVQERVKEFHVAILILETGMIGVFVALDLILFYVFWEAMLIPMYLLIGIWGYRNRIYAAVKFFIYTMAGSLLMFIAILYVYARAGASTFDIEVLYETLQLTRTEQIWLFIGFGVSFAVKVPLFPLHTWLPDAHVEAPTAGSVLLAGILLKMGVYGFLRFAIPFFPEAAKLSVPVISWLAIIGIIYAALMAFEQGDLKKLVAYSSVSHLGFVMLGTFSLTERGIQGGIYQMLSHGLSTGALFLIVGSIYERRHSREISDFGGYARVMPVMAAVFGITMLAAIGLPGLSGFVGEFLIITGALETVRLYGVLAATGVVLGAVYMLYAYKRVMLGPVETTGDPVPDLDGREMSYYVPLAALMVFLGLFPNLLLSRMGPSVERLLEMVGGT